MSGGVRRGALTAAFVASMLGVCVAASPQRGLEDQVKAAFLYNFIGFVDWPPNTFDRPSDPLRVCVAGEDTQIGRDVSAMAAHETVNQHPIVVSAVAAGAEPGACQLLFVPAGTPAPRLRTLVQKADAANTLTVGESPDFLRAGGMINFVVEEGHVRFDVNLIAMRAHRFTPSSKLLRVARDVWGGSGAR